MSKKAIDITAAATPAQGVAAQPDATPAAAEQQNQEQAPAEPSEREKQLETDLAEAIQGRDLYAGELATVRGELDKAHEAENAALLVVPLFDDPYAALDEEQFNTVLEIVLGEAHSRGIVTTQEETEATQPAQEVAEPTQEEYIKGLLRRNGLQKAWMLTSGPCFSEEHAKEFAGPEFNSLTVISLEENAGSK
jgi:hypothetical protein